MFKEKLTEEELKIARQNGFILTGKTGTGKSTLLNVIFGVEVAEAKSISFAVTKKSQAYYLKLNNGICITLVDTPGLSDPDNLANDKADLDNIHLKGIVKTISEEKIHIKGILFLVNFQMERFDDSEQRALISYNQIFPLKSFWKHLIVVFTHDFGDPNGDPPEERRKNKDESNGEIFSRLMEKVKDVSDIIDYKELKTKYYNSYSPVKTDKQKELNEINKADLEILLKEFCQVQPLFCQIEIKTVKNEKIKEMGKEYLVDSEIIGYFDFNNLPMYQKINILKKEEIKNDDQKKIPPVSVNVDVYKVQKNKKGQLEHVQEKGNEKNSKYVKNSIAGIGGLSGAALGGLGGIAYAGGIMSGVSLTTALTEGLALTATTLGAPIAIGVAAGAGIGYGLFKLFE